MIIKCISRKSNVGQLIRYVLKDEKCSPRIENPNKPVYVAGIKLTKEETRQLQCERVDAALLAELKAFKGTIKEFVTTQLLAKGSTAKEAENKSIVIKHNMRARSINGYIREFEENEKFRLNARVDSVKAFHTIISFSHLDSDKLNEKILRDFAQHYISLRAEKSVVVGGVHLDKGHVHMHLIQSGTQYLTGASNRISREAFKDITIAMQQFQKDKYPELVNSLVDHQKNKSSKNIDRANSKINSPERTKDKDVLLGLLETTYAKSTSVEHFLSQVKEHGHEPYFRNGRLQGIKFEGERKFRLTNLGFKEKLEELANRKESHAKSLYEIRNIRSRGKTIENTKNVHVIEKDNIDGVHLDLEQQAIQELSTMRENRSEQIQKEPIEDDIKNIPDDEAEDVDSTRYFASESDDESEV